MRAKPIYTLVLFLALTVSGCSVAPGMSGLPVIGGASSASAPAVAGSTPAPGGSSTSGSSQAVSNDPAIAAIQGVIQKANQAQQYAFAKNDPTIMQDTAASSYYNELVQINNDMANGGVSAIKLLGIDWGQVSLTGPTTAQATTFETWQTTYTDGSTDQAREQNIYTLVQQQGVWKIQSDNHPNASSGSSGGSPASNPSGSVAPSSPSTTVPPAAITPASQTSSSRNWAGYAATSGSFTAVTGTWTVPQSQGSGSFGTDATWVGIGGVTSRDLIQAGTEATTTQTGAVGYDAWIEMLPQASRPVQFAVKAGDSVTVSIAEQGTNQWLIKFNNNTTGESYQTTVQYQSSLSSAEWIEEAPSAGRGVLPLDNFGAVQFSGGSAVENGKSVTIAQAGAKAITLDGSRGNVLVTPSVLTPDGQGFTVSLSGSAPAPQGLLGSTY